MDLPVQLLRWARQLYAITREGAKGGAFVDREERVWVILIQIYVWVMGESLRGHPLAQRDLEHPCSKCGGKIRIQRVQQHRKIAGRLGTIACYRDYGRCDRCGISGAPLDFELGLGDAISAGLLKRVCHAAVVCRSFQDARDILQEHAMVKMSAKRVRELAEAEGRRVAQARDSQARAYAQHRLGVAEPQQAPRLIVVGADGGRVQTREEFAQWGSQARQDLSRAHAEKEAAEGASQKEPPERWKEDKVGVVYDAVAKPQPGVKHGEYRGAKAKVKTYVATMQPWDSFGWMLRLEAERRGYVKAQTRLFLADGAQHIRDAWQKHFHESVFILDWAHGSEHLGNCAKALFGEGSEKARGWYLKHKDMLWEGKLDALIEELEKQSRRLGKPEDGDSPANPRKVLHTNAYSYFPNNRAAMDYPRFRAQGWPIGSGVVEGAVKQFAMRVKGSEKFWNPGVEMGEPTLENDLPRPGETGAEEMLALAALYHCEDGRWQRHWDARGQPQPWE
jgi:hypothetical protein